MDTVINDYLIKEGGLEPTESEVVGYCVESQCRFKQSVAFPDKVQCGLRVGMISMKGGVTHNITHAFAFFFLSRQDGNK